MSSQALVLYCVCMCMCVSLALFCVCVNEWIASSGWPVYECSTYRIGFNVYSFYWSLIVLSRCEKCTGHLNLRLIFCKLFFFFLVLFTTLHVAGRLDYVKAWFLTSAFCHKREVSHLFWDWGHFFFFWPPCVFPQPLSFCHTCSHSPPETPHLMSPNKFF